MRNPEDIRRLREASQWFTRLRAEPNAEESLNAWLQWCELDPENGEAFRRVQILWRQLDQVYTDRAEIDGLNEFVRVSKLAKRIAVVPVVRADNGAAFAGRQLSGR